MEHNRWQSTTDSAHWDFSRWEWRRLPATLDSGTRFLVHTPIYWTFSGFSPTNWKPLIPPHVTQPESSLGVGAGKHCCLWWRSWKSNSIFYIHYVIYFQYFNPVYHHITKVTLAGESAGSFSAFYHLTSPPSTTGSPLFHRIIGQSGVGTKLNIQGYFNQVVVNYLKSRLVDCLHRIIIGVPRKEWVTFSSKRSSLGNILNFIFQKS